jgi:glycosyltransferase involved in cell wall biosynthesis
MIIGIDARVLQEGTGGVFVYTKNLLENLIPNAQNHEIKLFVNQYKRKPNKILTELSKYPNVKVYQYRFPNKFLNASFRFFKWPKIDELIGGCDILFFPGMLYASWSDKCKTVITMHDLSFEIFPEFFTTRQNIWHKLVGPKDLCERADSIIAVSHSTKQDIEYQYGISNKKITTVHSGVDNKFRPVIGSKILNQVKKHYNLPNAPFILQTGTIEPRKNHELALSAFIDWKKNYPEESKEFHLVFAGHNGWKSESLIDQVRDSEFSDNIHIVKEVRVFDFPALYSLSSIFCYPSHYEGFGFPILEAFACGIPVIAASNSSLGEVTGNAALLINAHRVDEMVQSIRKIINDEDLAKSLRAKGLTQTVNFSWDKTAKETLQIIENTYAHRN